MNKISFGLLGLATSLFIFGDSFARAEETSLIVCIKKYTDLGVSPDSALSECKQSTVSACVKKLLSGNFIATSTKHVEVSSSDKNSGYLIDLGNADSRWLEGGQWAEKGCSAYTLGPYKREEVPKKGMFGKRRSYQWFRQGWCSTPSIELDQPFTLNEAKTRCELGIVPDVSEVEKFEYEINTQP